MQVPECHGSTSAQNWLPRRPAGASATLCLRAPDELRPCSFSRLWTLAPRLSKERGPWKKKKRKENSRPLMQTVKNNNQECSIREMHSPRLWVLQVDCTVITSPENPGEESFHEKRGRTGKAGELHALQASLCSPPSWNKIWMLISHQQTEREHKRHLCCLLAMKCFCLHTRTPTHTWHIRTSRADLTVYFRSFASKEKRNHLWPLCQKSGNIAESCLIVVFFFCEGKLWLRF